MNCQTIRQEELHEKHILDRLNEDERSQFEAHLAECAECHAEFEQQKNLILGIKEVGREQLKQEIRQQAAELETVTSSGNWGTVAKIAAVLFVMLMTPAVYFVVKDQTSVKKTSIPVTPQSSTFRRVAPEQSLDEEAAPAPQDKATPQSLRENRSTASKKVRSTTPSQNVISEAAGDFSPTKSQLKKEGMFAANEPVERQDDLVEVPKLDFAKSDLLELDRATKGFLRVDTLSFHWQNTVVVVQFDYADIEVERDKQTGFPHEIPVTVVYRDSNRVELSWQVPPYFSLSQIADAQISISENFGLVTFELPPGQRYDIDIVQDSTRAVLKR